ncbi:MAG TPA: CoA-binding protein [Chthonomonadaceae bacterium]|nr:CoA-binding protein [Chthonomonadaceae bacterium]
MNDPVTILDAATTILLVDWPNSGVPKALVESGFTVYGYSPGGYSMVELAEAPSDGEGAPVAGAATIDRGATVQFRLVDAGPTAIDLVCVYRPLSELESIVEQHAVPLGATAIWLQSQEATEAAREIAAEHGLTLIESLDIADAARTMRKGPPARKPG